MICALSPEEQKWLTQKIAVELKKAAADKKGFNLNEYIQHIYDAELSSSEDPQRALLYAQEVPKLIDKILPFLTDVKDLIKTNVGLDKFDDLVQKFKSLDYVSSVLIAPEKEVADIQQAVEQEKSALQSSKFTPEVESTPKAPTSRKLKPQTMSATHTNYNLIRDGKEREKELERNVIDPSMIPYLDFQEHLVSLMNRSNWKAGDPIHYPGVVGGLWFTAVSAYHAIPEKHLYPSTVREYLGKTVVMVVTDKDGNFLYFNNAGKVVPESEGKLMYYNMRTIPSKDASGNYDYAAAKVQTPKEIAERSNGTLTEEEAQTSLDEETAKIEEVYNYINANPTKNKLVGTITGGTAGSIKMERENAPTIAEINLGSRPFNLTFELIKGSTSATALIQFEGSSEKIPVDLMKLENEDILKIARLLTDKIFVKDAISGKERLLTDAEKVAKLEGIIYLKPLDQNKNKQRMYIDLNNDQLQIYIDGKLIDLTNKEEAARQIEEVLGQIYESTTLKKMSEKDVKNFKGKIWDYGVLGMEKAIPGKDMIRVKTPEGDVYHWVQSYSYHINKNMFASNSIIDAFSFETKKDGSTLLVSTPVKYRDWVAAHTKVPVKLNAEAKPVMLNGYLTYGFEEDAVKKLKEPTPQIEVPKPSLNLSGPRDLSQTEFDKLLDDAINKGLLKTTDQKGIEQKATREQIQAAKDWYESHPISNLIPFHEAFTLINTKSPDGIAEWTTQGITLFMGSDYTDLYHEAWHGFTQMFLTKKQKQDLYAEARRRQGSFKDYKGNYIQFSKANDLQLEEFMAERFREFMLSGGKVSNLSKIERSIFQKILDFLKALFEGLSVKDVVANREAIANLNDLFSKLRMGNISEYTFDAANRNFHVLNQGMRRTKLDEPMESLEYFDSKLMVDTIDSLIVSIINTSESKRVALRQLEAEKISQETGAPIEPATRKVLDISKILKDPQLRKGLYQAVNLQLRELHNTVTSQKDKDLIRWAVNNFGNINDPLSIAGEDGVMAYHFRKSKFLSFDDVYSTLEEEEDHFTRFDRAGNEQSLMELAIGKDDVIALLNGIYVPIGKSNEFNRLGVRNLMEPELVWNELAKILEGGLSKVEMFEKLKAAQTEHPIVIQVLNKLGDPNARTLDGNVIPDSFKLWSNFHQVFDRVRIPLVQVTVDTTTGTGNAEEEEGPTFSVTFGSTSARTIKVERVWNNEFKAALPSKANYIRKDDKGNNYLDLEKLIPAEGTYVPGPFEKLDSRGYRTFDTKKAFEFLEAIGVKLSDTPFIREYVTSSAKEGELKIKMLYNRLKYIRNHPRREAAGIVMDGLNAIFKTEWGHVLGDSSSLLDNFNSSFKRLSELEARYSPFATPMVTNAAGDTQYEHSLHSSISKIITAVNSVSSYHELMSKYPYMHYLDIQRNPFAKSSRMLNAIFDFSTPEGLKRQRNGENVKLMLENYSGIALTIDNLIHNKDNSIAAASADINARRLADFHAFILNGYTSGFQASDKATTLLIGTNNLQPIGGDVTGENFEGSITGNYYVDMPYFAPTYINDEAQPSKGRRMANRQMMYYLEAELRRIYHMESLPEDAIEKRLYITTKNGKSITYYDQGKDFVIFSDILTDDLKKKIKKDAKIKAGLTSPLKSQTLVGYLLDNNAELYNQIEESVNNYFNKQVENFYSGLGDKKLYINDNASRRYSVIANEHKIKGIRSGDMERAMVDSYVYNYWMHNYELMSLIFGDIAQYNHDKEEFHKRDSAFQSTGEMFSNDFITQDYINNTAKIDHFINSQFFDGVKPSTPIWNGLVNAAVMADKVTSTLYKEEYIRTLKDREVRRLKNSIPYKEGKLTDKEIEARANAVAEEYLKMKEGDAQGWISFDAYRALAIAQSNWTDEQEELFHKILKGEYKPTGSVDEYFPVRKFQYSGYMQTSEGLPAVAFHKFSLLPLIPGVTYQKGSNLEKLAVKMAEQNIHYSLFQSGSKVLTLTKDGNLDKFYSEGRNLAITEPTYQFTPNVLYVEYLKDQLKINETYKGNVTFSTQMRKLIELGLMENGVPTDFKTELTIDQRRAAWKALPDEKSRVKASKKYELLLQHETLVKELTETRKLELLEEAGLTLKKDGTLSGDISGIIKLVRRELTRQDLADHEIDFFDIDPQTGKVKKDASFSFSAEKVERVLMALVNKRLIRQKVNGESLVLVSNTGMEDSNLAAQRDFTKATTEELKKYGSNDLPTYHRDPKSGKTRAMKVKVALQGDFRNLLNLSTVIEKAKKDKTDRLTALNALLKDDHWLNQSGHRDMVTMVGVRIPVQGLNSMEFMEVYEFLPEAAGNILIPPTEIVGKSGSDFDIDKLSVLMPNITSFDGKVELAPKLKSKSIKALYDLLKQAKVDKLSTKGIKTKDLQRYLKPSDLTIIDKVAREMLGDNYVKQLEDVAREGMGSLQQFTLKLKGKYLENQLIFNSRAILELPENYENLIRPNSKDLVEPTAKDLAQFTRDYDPLYRVNGTKQKNISPTRVFEIDYNLFKQASNSVGKQALGIGAVDNSYNAVFNRVGAYMNSGVGITTSEYKKLKAKYDENPKSLSLAEERMMKNYYPQNMYLPHNTMTVNGNKVISLSHSLDANNENNIADIISQLINGWVDVAKDAWIFDIQGNKQVSPVLLYMIQAGVPFKHAVYLVSNPLVREYIKQQQAGRSAFAGPLQDAPEKWQFFVIQARSRILNQSKYGFNKKDKYYRSKNKELATDLLKKVEATPNILSLDNLYSRISDKSKIYNDTDRAAFLQYLLIEEQARSIRDLKLRTNPDTKKSSTIFEGLVKRADYELLFNDVRLPADLVTNIMENSPIASFGVHKFAANLWKPLFELRIDETFTNYIIDKLRYSRKDIENTFGNAQTFINNLRNDFPNYLFQNVVRGFNVNTPNYKGISVEEKEGVPTENALTRRGVYITKGKIYVDKAQLKSDFDNHGYSSNNYSTLKYPLAQVSMGAFKSADEYYHFVFEREYIRSNNNLTKLKGKLRYRSALFNNLAIRNKIAGESAEDFKTRMERVTYEEVIRDMALENILNPWKLFESSTSYAQQFLEVRSFLMAEKPEFYNRFQLFNMLGVKMSDKGKGLKNINLQVTNPNTDVINSLYSELQYLSNASSIDSGNPQIDEYVADFFKRMPYYAMLQSGLNIDTEFSLGRILPEDSFTRIMEEPGKVIMEKLKKIPETGDYSLLDNFYYKFITINKANNSISRRRLRDYLIPTVPESAEVSEEALPLTPIAPGIESLSGENLGLSVTKWREKFGKEGKINTVMKTLTDNPDKVFVYNSTVDPAKGSLHRDFIFGDAARRAKVNNVIGIPTRLLYEDDNMKTPNLKRYHVSDETYNENIARIDQAIDLIKKAQEAGKTIVFLDYGYGQALAGAFPYTGKSIDETKALAPKTFLHLSQRLMEIGYKNNNFDQILAGREQLQRTAGQFTDQQVEDKILECYS